MRAFKRDLHDGVQQTLAAARMDVDGLMDDLQRGQVPSTGSLETLTGKLDVALGQVRGLAQGRQAPELAGGIEHAVGAAARELRLDADIGVADVDLGDLATPVYLIVREALVNVHKHANAERVSVQVASDGQHVFVGVRDDGVGGADAGGNGMTGMRARAEELGGSFKVTSSPKTGTAIEVRLPCAS
jgi:signal transduction histidine kinase